MMMEESDKGESSTFVIFKFAPEVLRHVRHDSLLKLKPNIAYEISLGMRTVEDVINSIREEFAIPINIRSIKIRIIMEEKEALLIPRLSVKAFTHASRYFRIESSETPRKAVSFFGDQRVVSSGIKIFPGCSSSSNEASEGRKRLDENPAQCEMVPAKRQRSSSNDGTEDSTNLADRDAEETYGNVGGNAVQPKVDKIEPLTSPGSILSQFDQVPMTSMSPQKSSSLSKRRNKGSWSPAGCEDVKPHQIIQLQWTIKEAYVVIMKVTEVEEDVIRTLEGGLDSEQCIIIPKSAIEEIEILTVNGEAFYERDDGVLWSPAAYEDVKPHQLIELNVKYEQDLFYYIISVTEVEEDWIKGLRGEIEVRASKSEIEEIRILTINTDAVYFNDV